MNEIIWGEVGGMFLFMNYRHFFFSSNFYFLKNLHPKAFLSLSIM